MSIVRKIIGCRPPPVAPAGRLQIAPARPAAVAIHIEHFGTEQPDTFRAVANAPGASRAVPIFAAISIRCYHGNRPAARRPAPVVFGVYRQRLRDLIITAHRVIRVNRRTPHWASSTAGCPA